MTENNQAWEVIKPENDLHQPGDLLHTEIPVEDLNLSNYSKEKINLTKADNLQHNIDLIQASMEEVYTGTFDHTKAERIAALAWLAQLDLARFLPDANLRAKQAKTLTKVAKANADVKYRKVPGEDGKRRTENQIEQLVTSDSEVIAAENTLLQAEHDAEKWECVLNTIKDGHIFFRNLNKV